GLHKLIDNSFFFFQAVVGIRNLIVTGVQTCALPIIEIFQTRMSFLSFWNWIFGGKWHPDNAESQIQKWRHSPGVRENHPNDSALSITRQNIRYTELGIRVISTVELISASEYSEAIS